MRTGRETLTGVARSVPRKRTPHRVPAELGVPQQADVTAGRVQRLVPPDVRVLHAQLVRVIRDRRARQ